MKKFQTRNALLAVGTGLALVGAAACNNDKLTNLNVNPNSPQDVPASSIFTNAALTTAQRWLGAGYSLRETEFVSQHLAEVTYPDEDDYKRLSASDTQGSFDGAYQGELEDFQKVIQKGKAANDAGTWAPADIMQVLDFAYLTNTWGDIPYKQALAGDSVGGAISPVYDTQQSIYTDFFARLDADAKALSGAKNSLGKADPLYAGDPGEWQKFANSLRLRLAMQIVNIDASTASTQIQAALAAPGGVFTSNGDNAEIHWPGDGVFDNPWADNFKTRDDHRMSNTFMNILLASNDPRIAVFAQPTVADPSKYAGMPNGLTQSTAAPYTNISSRPGLVFWPPANAYNVQGGNGLATPSFFMTYAEVSFIKAEAAQRGIGGAGAGSAATNYANGIAASFDQWGVSGAAAYTAQSGVALQAGNAGVAQIDQQEWIALYTDGGTAWSLWRRTCVPGTLKPGPNAISNTVPRRFMYSPTEASVNNTQLQAAIARQGPDVFQTSMWWDTVTAAPTYFAGCGSR